MGVEPSHNRQSNEAASVEHSIPTISVVFVAGELVVLSAAKYQVGEFLARRSPKDLGESPAVYQDEATPINRFNGDLDWEADSELADLMQSTDLSSQASICFDFGCFREACSIVG